MFLSSLTIVLTLVACGEKTVTETDEEIIDVDGTITFRKWPLYTDETDTLIYSKRIISISTPSDEVANLYKKTINS